MTTSNQNLSEPRSKHLWRFKYINVISSSKSKMPLKQKRSKMPMISTGSRILVATGNKKRQPLPYQSLMSNLSISTSSLVQKNVFVSLLLLIAVTLLFLKPLEWCTEVLQLAQQEQVRLKLLKISVVHSVFSSSLQTALMSTSSETWLRFSKVFVSLDFGAASMNSIVFHLLLYLSLLPKLNQSLKQRNKN